MIEADERPYRRFEEVLKAHGVLISPEEFLSVKIFTAAEVLLWPNATVSDRKAAQLYFRQNVFNGPYDPRRDQIVRTRREASERWREWIPPFDGVADRIGHIAFSTPGMNAYPQGFLSDRSRIADTLEKSIDFLPIKDQQKIVGYARTWTEAASRFVERNIPKESALALAMYGMKIPLESGKLVYDILYVAMSKCDDDELFKWESFIYHVLDALLYLPTKECVVFKDLVDDPDALKINGVIEWKSICSCTLRFPAYNSSQEPLPGKVHYLFEFHTKSARLLEGLVPGIEEAVIMPYTRFRVTSITPYRQSKYVLLVVLEEMDSFCINFASRHGPLPEKESDISLAPCFYHCDFNFVWCLQAFERRDSAYVKYTTRHYSLDKMGGPLMHAFAVFAKNFDPVLYRGLNYDDVCACYTSTRFPEITRRTLRFLTELIPRKKPVCLLTIFYTYFAIFYAGDAQLGLPMLKFLVDNGVYAAMNYLGILKFKGAMVPQDTPGAHKLFAEAAAHLFPPAVANKYALDLLLPEGSAERTTAAIVLKDLAEQSYSYASNNFGLCYFNGLAPKSYKFGKSRLQQAMHNTNPQFMRTFAAMEDLTMEGVGDVDSGFDMMTTGEGFFEMEAWVKVAHCLDVGWGVTRDSRLAFDMYRYAASNGNAVALNNLGTFYHKGRVVERDLKTAVGCYRWATKLGFPWGLYNLAVCTFLGEGVEKDLKKAWLLFKLAAQKGLPNALNALGWFYEHGEVVEKDEAKALRFYKTGLDLYDALALVNVAHCYEEGIGTSRDIAAAAHHWTTLGKRMAYFSESFQVYSFPYFMPNPEHQRRITQLLETELTDPFE